MDAETGRAVAAVTSRQRGLITREQLRTAGVSASTIRRWARSGLLVPAGARTFRTAAAAPTDRAAVLAACLDRGAVASHRTAAWLHDLLPHPGRIDVTVPKGRATALVRADPRQLRVHASTNLPDDDVTEVDGIPVTSLARTLMSLGALVPAELAQDELLDVVAAALESRAVSMAWLRWVLEERRCRGRDGVTAFEQALEERERIGPTESWLERRLLRVIAAAGLPTPEVQRVVPRRPGVAARVDLLYPAERVVVEALGYAFHRTPDQLMADTMRANDLMARGHLVVQITARQLRRHPDSVPTSIAAVLALRRPVLSRSAVIPGA